MGAIKEMLYECHQLGLVPVEAKRIDEWRKRMGPTHGAVLDGMPLTHYYTTRQGESVPLDVLPVGVARQVGRLLPDTHDELGWMIECFEE